MMKKFCMAALMGTALTTTTAYAAGMTDGWSGEASLNGGLTTGNTDTQDLGFGMHIAKEADVWRHNFDAQADYGKVSGDKNKQRWSLGYQLDRDINDRAYVFGNADYFQDSFGAFKDGYFVGAGLGYKVLIPDPIGWNLEGGAGYRSQKARGYLDTTATPNVYVGSERNNEFALRGASDFDWILNENVSLYNDTEITWSKSDTYIWDEAGIKANLAGNLSAFASFRVDNHSDVPPGLKKTDTTTRFGLIYGIK